MPEKQQLSARLRAVLHDEATLTTVVDLVAAGCGGMTNEGEDIVLDVDCMPDAVLVSLSHLLDGFEQRTR